GRARDGHVRATDRARARRDVAYAERGRAPQVAHELGPLGFERAASQTEGAHAALLDEGREHGSGRAVARRLARDYQQLLHGAATVAPRPCGRKAKAYAARPTHAALRSQSSR